MKIVPEDVEVCFQQANMIPTRGVMEDGIHACALGAMQVAMDWDVGKLAIAYGSGYLCGFMQGWDGATLPGDAPEEVRDGHVDGVLAWLHMEDTNTAR